VSSITGIELGPDSCVLVRARQRDEAAEVSAFHQVKRDASPAGDSAVAVTLRALRKSKDFPRRARVVAWGVTEPANDAEGSGRSLVAAVVEAGFRVERVLTPPEALAQIARTRPRGRGVATAWLALNVRGAAIAIVRDGTLLFGRTFAWTYTSADGPRAELLQRYSLVAHLAPEVRRGITLVRSSHGAIVEAAVTCGDLPDLRSLTMPLIEELDLEVETLDSTDGLVATKPLSEPFAGFAPAMRLAAAAATMRLTKEPRVSPLVRAGAAAVIIGTAGWLGYQYWMGGPLDVLGPRESETPHSVPVPTAGTLRAGSPQGSATFPAPTASAPGQRSSTVTRSAPPVAAPPVATSAARATTQPPVSKPAPQATTPSPFASKPAAQATTPPTSASKPAPQATTPPTPVPKPVPQATPPPPVSKPAPPVARAPAAAPPARAVTDSLATKPAATPPTRPAVVRRVMEPAAPITDTSRRKPVPLTAAVPTVESILVAPDRRVAVIDGQIVTVGDQVGPRIVAGIEQAAVVLQEPSGYQIRVPIRRGRGTD
jgi:hypothetical protein